MASVLLSSVGNGQQFFDNNGIPLSGGLIYTYQAGTSTPLATYTDNSGNTANANPIVLDSSGRVPYEIWMFTGYSYKFVIQTSAGASIQTLDNLYPILQNAPASAPAIPSGGIILWSGSTGSVPSGWYLCDGTNGTPDLRNSFIVGAGNTYAVGATGGATTSTLTQANLPNVNFSATSTVTDPGHKHNVTNGNGTLYTGSYIAGATSVDAGTNQTATATTGITVATTVASGGSASPVAILPPYYALAYIQKA
jgi:hypothetical protein